MITCHGTEGDHHAPTSLEADESDVAGHANLTCPVCGVTLETDESTALRVAEA